MMILTWNLDQQLNLTRGAKQRQENLATTWCHEIVMALSFFWIYDHFGAIRKPDSRRRVCKTYISINNNFLSCKNCGKLVLLSYLIVILHSFQFYFLLLILIDQLVSQITLHLHCFIEPFYTTIMYVKPK